MNFKTRLGFLVCSISCVFGALLRTEKDNNTEISRSNSNVNSDLPIFKLTPYNFLQIFEYLDNTYFDLLSVSKDFTNMMNNQQKILFKSLNINPILKNVESDAEIYHLLNLMPMTLNQFFEDFVYSDHCFKIMKISIKNNLKSTPNSLNQIIFEYWIDSSISNSSGSEHKYVGLLFRKVENFKMISQLIVYNFTQINRDHLLYEKSRSIVGALLSRCNFDKSLMIIIFKSQLCAEEIEYLLQEHSKKDAIIAHYIRDVALNHEIDYTTEEKLLIRIRNEKLLSSMAQREASNIEIINVIRYSETSGSDALIEKYFTGKGCAFSHSLTESFAIAAIQAKNIDLFLKMYHLRDHKKFSVKFYKLIANSKNLMQILPTEAVIDFFEIPEAHYMCYTGFLPFGTLDWIFRFELLARMSFEERVVVDLQNLFLNDKLGFMFALALYYPIDHFFESLNENQKYVPEILSMLYLSSLKYRNNLNSPIAIVHEFIKFIPSLNEAEAEKARNLIKNLFKKVQFIKDCVDPNNLSMFADLIQFKDEEIDVESLPSAILKDEQFRNNLASPLVVELIDSFYINIMNISTEIQPLSRDITTILSTLGLEIGNFDAISHQSPCFGGVVKQLKGKQLDNILIETALSQFENQKADYLGKFNMNPMMLNSFGYFQLWWERNPQSFEELAPSEIVEDFKKRLG